MRRRQYADFAVLSEDFFGVPESQIKALSAVMTVVGGKVVHGSDEFADLAPPMPKASPEWSPVGRYQRLANSTVSKAAAACCAMPCGVHGHRHLFAALAAAPASDSAGFWGSFGCGCAF